MINENLTNYLIQLLPAQENWVVELERQATEEHVPIMDPVSMHLLTQIIRIQKPERILEIGTAIGYSALRMLQANSEATVVTIERDWSRYRKAIANIKKLEKQDKIDVIFGDALETAENITAKGPFDLLFIDAAKGQYERFFTLYSQTVAKGGLIITDNVLFKGYVEEPSKEHPRFTKLGQKIRHYNDWLIKNPDYMTSIVPIGDGVAISIKK
ncbi:SAM-dependent methyltransferase [Virgibacillus dakarensis]|uniref:O-methyltransferase n=1 Tax=Virgibacillus dakarensis TaxID=1917889 RepID=UPI000B44B4DB|nr:O-methyltransferase [Virgibacillus dakarensis]MBT2215101.1 O-methyltransferase [Virgibacillus dakarensis]MTW84154.1 SAM-dependent methyltransferase [Virgibacillus dakarensis]